MNSEPDPTHHPANKDVALFANTLWSTILKAGSEQEAVRAPAMERLLARYRKPIILHIQYSQRSGYAEAEELAHDFFQHWMRSNLLAGVAPEGGRFRTFIKQCIRNFLIDKNRKQSAAKRTPPMGIAALDALAEDASNAAKDPQAPQESAAEVMDRTWARSVVDHALGRLELEWGGGQRLNLYNALRPTLIGDPSPQARDKLAQDLGISLANLHTTVHRMRKRLRELIEETIRDTVSSPEDWRSELRYLIDLLSTPSATPR